MGGVQKHRGGGEIPTELLVVGLLVCLVVVHLHLRVVKAPLDDCDRPSA